MPDAKELAASPFRVAHSLAARHLFAQQSLKPTGGTTVNLTANGFILGSPSRPLLSISLSRGESPKLADAMTTMLEQLRSDALSLIRAAFSDDDPPAWEEMRNSHCPECLDVSALFAGKRWTEVAVSDLEGNPSPSLLTASAFRFYFPAMMTCTLQDADVLDCFPDELVGVLSLPGGKWSEKDLARFQDLTLEQIGSVVAFLRFMRTREMTDWTAVGVPEGDVEALPASKPIERAVHLWDGLFRKKAEAEDPG